jgi:hypothetical protein
VIYIYYHVVSIQEYKSNMRPFFEEGKKFGLISIVQKRNQPEYFMEVISAKPDVGAQLKDLSDLRRTLGLDKFLLNRKIHVEIFDKLLDVGEDGTTKAL